MTALAIIFGDKAIRTFICVKMDAYDQLLLSGLAAVNPDIP